MILMVAKKKPVEEEEIEEDEENFEDDSIEEEKFTCRVCKKTVNADEGDDMIIICDSCAEGYDIDKIWDDFDREKILEEKLQTFDLTPYELKKKAKKK
jgi:CRISPR/Cas system-associated protein Cas10 (large subunit of type III CRISPR-Cas system)